MITKEAKAAYDRLYRKKNRALLKAKKAAYFQLTYDPKREAIERKKKMPQHVEYCRQPWYRAYKKEYDKKRRAARFGEFAAAYEALKDLRAEIKRQMPDRFQRYAQAGRYQWNPINHQRYGQRKGQRNEQFTYGYQLERVSLGNA